LDSKPVTVIVDASLIKLRKVRQDRANEKDDRGQKPSTVVETHKNNTTSQLGASSSDLL